MMNQDLSITMSPIEREKKTKYPTVVKRKVSVQRKESGHRETVFSGLNIDAYEARPRHSTGGNRSY